MELTASERQLEMLRIYADLLREHESWAGKLVVAFGLYAHLVPVPVSIAGGAALLIDEDAAAIKAAMRRGELDFAVNTLDEALRVLKNEIRQKRAVGVGLISPVAEALVEMAERGVSPDFMLRGAGHGSLEYGRLEQVLQQLSDGRPTCRHFALRDPERWQPSQALFGQKPYSASHVAAKTLADLRAADELLLAKVPAGDEPRRRWLQLLPRYVRDSVEGGRWVWLSEEEFDAVSNSLPISPESRP